jgi:hypothetical protein
MIHRLAVLEASTDPVQQFERLSGRRLAPVLPNVPDVAAEEQPAGRGLAVAVSSDRDSVLHHALKRIAKWTATALVLGLAVYGALGLVSYFSQSDLDRLAALDRAAIPTQALQMRSTELAPDYDSSEALYNRAMPLLREARTHRLGLFPHYRPATLREAASLLERVVEQEDSTSLLRAEAAYWLARVRLAQKDVEGARTALQSALDGTGWKAREARSLLDDIEALSR